MLIPEKEPSFWLLEFCPRNSDPEREDYDPIDVFDEIFTFATLNELRSDLWEILKCALKDDEVYDTPTRRNNLIFIYSLLHDALTAAYIALKKREDEKIKAEAMQTSKS